jgi:hypothetical protein
MSGDESLPLLQGRKCCVIREYYSRSRSRVSGLLILILTNTVLTTEDIWNQSIHPCLEMNRYTSRAGNAS